MTETRQVPMSEYLLSQQSAPEFERSRLRLLEEFHDPLTTAQLDAIGVGEGWRCLDVGAGGGSVTRMLARRVNASGSVLAVDFDTSLLDALADDRIRVRRLDVRSEPLPAETFDLVHARLLVMHLPARIQTLGRLASAVRPGGWVAAVEPDFTTVTLSPINATWERTWPIFLDALVAGGWDPRYGARLAGDLAAVGLVDVSADHVSSRGPGGSPILRLLSLTIERLRDRMIALGADGEQIDQARRLLEDPAQTISSQTTCVVRARRRRPD
jgi:SAM-dependent methyltransferase